jgi:signal peptidase complex subunit 3
MFNSLTRLQNVFGFFTTVVFSVAALIAATDLLSARTPTAALVVNDVQVSKGRPHYYSNKRQEYASIKFSMDADLSTLFTWNTKQVFVYVTAEWASHQQQYANATNEAVIWDQIITAPSADWLSTLGPASLKKLRKSSEGKSVDRSRGILKIRNQRPKYHITHPSSKIGHTPEVRLRLHYNVQPWVGPLVWDQEVDLGLWKKMDDGLSEAFDLPPVKPSSK